MNGKGPAETVELISEDEQSFIVDARCISLIGIFRPTILAAGAVPPSLSMSTIKSPVLAKLIEWMEAHREDAAASPASASATSHIAGNQSDDELRSSESEFEEILDDDAATQHTDAALDDLASGKRHILREHMQFEEGSMQFAAALGPWDRKFFQALDLGTLIELTKAANFLDVAGLLDMCCRTIANHMKGLTAEQLRQKFNIVNDLTPEEEEAIRREQAWCEE